MDPGIFYWGGFGGVQTLVQKGLLNFFVANYFSATPPPPPVAEKAETTTCFLICESRSPLAREILVFWRVPRHCKGVPTSHPQALALKRLRIKIVGAAVIY